MWLSYSLATAIFWGLGQVFIKKGLYKTTPLFNNIVATILAILIWIPYSLINGINFNNMILVYCLTLAVALFYISFFYIIALGKLAITGSIIATYPVYTILLSTFFLKESITISQIAAILIIIISCSLILFPGKFDAVIRKQLLILPIIGAMLLGFGDFFAKIAINISNPSTYIFFLSLSFPLVIFILYFFDKKGRQIPKENHHNYFFTFIGIAINHLGFITLSLALSQGLASLVTPITSGYIAIMVLGALFILKEKISKIQLIGIGFCLIGILLI